MCTNHHRKKLCFVCGIWILASFIFISPYLLWRNEPIEIFSRRKGSSPPTVENFSRLFDVNEFEFTINVAPCDIQQLLLILVHSAPDHFAERQTIRNTWGQKTGHGDPFKLAFLLGGVDSAESQELIRSESSIHSDIIQGNFRDAYHNLTYKFAMGLKWTTYYCASAEFLLKMDDDAFVNTKSLLNHMSRLRYDEERDRSIYCKVCQKCYVFREKASKWYVSYDEYARSFYPPFCFGFVVLSTSAVAVKLYYETQRNDYWRIDDVYITGILSRKVNLIHSDLSEFMLDRPKFEEIRENATRDVPSFLFGPPQMNTSEIENLWRLVEKSASKDNFD